MRARPGRDPAAAGGAPRLFPARELCLRRTGTARLGDLARHARPRGPTERERRREDDRRAIDLLRAHGAELAADFGLRIKAIEAEREGVTAHYGICYEDGLIRIRLRHAKTGRPLKQSSLVDTLCHELAHLRHLNHGMRFRRLYQQILAAARRLGYYRPGPVQQSRPRQGELFRAEGCGV